MVATKITDIRVEVDVSDGSRNYIIEVFKDPAGTPTLLTGATLTLSSGSTTAQASVNVTIPASTSIGVRFRRTSGSGTSNFQYGQVSIGLE